MAITSNTPATAYAKSGAWVETSIAPSYYANFWFNWTPNQTATEVLNFTDSGLLQIFTNYTDASSGNNAVFDSYVNPGNFNWAVTSGVPLYLHYQFTGSDDFTITATGAPAAAPAFWTNFVATREII